MWQLKVSLSLRIVWDMCSRLEAVFSPCRVIHAPEARFLFIVLTLSRGLSLSTRSISWWKQTEGRDSQIGKLTFSAQLVADMRFRSHKKWSADCHAMASLQMKHLKLLSIRGSDRDCRKLPTTCFKQGFLLLTVAHGKCCGFTTVRGGLYMWKVTRWGGCGGESSHYIPSSEDSRSTKMCQC